MSMYCWQPKTSTSFWNEIPARVVQNCWKKQVYFLQRSRTMRKNKGFLAEKIRSKVTTAYHQESRITGIYCTATTSQTATNLVQFRRVHFGLVWNLTTPPGNPTWALLRGTIVARPSTMNAIGARVFNSSLHRGSPWKEVLSNPRCLRPRLAAYHSWHVAVF